MVFAGLLTGEVKAFRYDEDTGESSSSWSTRPTKRTMRSIDISENGECLWTGGKSGSILCVLSMSLLINSQIDSAIGTVIKDRDGAHESPVNRIYCVNEQLVASGDDEGVIKFWDARQEDSIRSYTHHFDYISDFTYFDDKRHLVSTS